MQGALNHVADHNTFREPRLAMGTQVVTGIELSACPINCELLSHKGDRQHVVAFEFVFIDCKVRKVLAVSFMSIFSSNSRAKCCGCKSKSLMAANVRSTNRVSPTWRGETLT